MTVTLLVRLFAPRLGGWLLVAASQAALLGGVPPASAQARPFEELDVTVAGVLSGPDAALTRVWDVSPGALLRAEVPFYVGRAFVATSAARYTVGDGAAPGGGDAPVPEYWAFHVFGGLAYPLPLPGGVELTPGLHTGVFAWRFDPRFGLGAEYELASGLDLRLSIPLRPRWRLSVGAWTTRVLVAGRLDYTFAHAGLSWRLPVPAWLRGVLQ